MHPRLAKQIFDFERRLVQKRIPRFPVQQLADFGDRLCPLLFAPVERGIERNRVRIGHQAVGNEFRQRAQLLRRKSQHAPDRIQRRFRLERAERRNLRDVVRAVMLRHVLDDFRAAIHAKIDVEVGHADAFGV